MSVKLDPSLTLPPSELFKERISSCAESGTSLHYLGTLIQKPFWMATEVVAESFYTALTPGQYGQCESRTMEIFKRILLVMGALISLPLGLALAVCGSLLQALGSSLMDNPYIQMRGEAPEVPGGIQDKILNLNAAALEGLLPRLTAGVAPASARMEPLSCLILAHDPDFLFLQEVSASAAYSLAHLLKGRYAHIFFEIGPQACGFSTCLFVAAKRPILSQPRFLPFDIGGANGFNRGLFYFETDEAWMIVTHFHPEQSAEGRQLRKRAMEKTLGLIAYLKTISHKKCILAADLNVRRRRGAHDDEYSALSIADHFIDPYLNEELSTCSDHIAHEQLGQPCDGNCSHIIDYTFATKDPASSLRMRSTPFVAYDEGRLGHALSDHRGIITEVVYGS